jgi:hypothetical protein
MPSATDLALFSNDLPLSKVDLPLSKVDLPLSKVDLPLSKVDLPLSKVDLPLLIADLPRPPLPTRHARLLRTRGIRCCSLDFSGLVVVSGEIKSKGKTSLLPSEAVTDMGPLLPSQPSLRSGSHAHLCQSVKFRPTPSPPWPAVVREIRQPARRLNLPYAACLQQDLYRVGQLVRWIDSSSAGSGSSPA